MQRWAGAWWGGEEWVDSNAALWLRPPAAPPATDPQGRESLQVLMRLPLQSVCGGVCSGQFSISATPNRLGLLLGLSDAGKAALLQASEPQVGLSLPLNRCF